MNILEDIKCIGFKDKEEINEVAEEDEAVEWRLKKN